MPHSRRSSLVEVLGQRLRRLDAEAVQVQVVRYFPASYSSLARRLTSSPIVTAMNATYVDRLAVAAGST